MPPSWRGRLGRPAVVGAADLAVDVAARRVRAGGRTLPEGTLITIDGSGGEVVAGACGVVPAETDPSLLRWADEVSGGDPDRPETERLTAAHAVLRRR